MLRHHPDDELLFDYAAGSLSEPVALIVATHMALCPACRSEVARFEAMGGAMMAELPPYSVEGLLDGLMARLDEPEKVAAAATRDKSASSPGDMRVPQPLRGYLGKGLESLAWKSMPGVREAEILAEREDFKTRLLQISPAKAMPLHTHEGMEYTLVLTGGFTDGDRHYLRGDVAVADEEVNHQPVADPGEPCLCLAVTDAPLRLTGPLGRLLNPFVKI